MSGFLRAVRERLFAPTGWWMTASLTALAALMRLPNLGRPNEFSFDETYYAKDAYSLLHFGYEKAFIDDANAKIMAGNLDVFRDAPEFVVHPPLGKWAIALGEWMFGMNPFGWRIVMAVLGILAVALVHRTMLRLSSNVYTAAVAGLFMAIDGLAIVMSRTALLDQTLMFLVLCTFFALVRDRDQYTHTLVLREYLTVVPSWRSVRPWRLLAIVAITAAFATKWSALWFALAFATMAFVWDARARREHGITASRTWLGDIAWLLFAVVAGVGGYLLSWIGWFRSDNAWDRAWSNGVAWLPQPLRAFVYYHQQALEFHTNLTSDHPYKALSYFWPLMVRPTSFSYNTYSAGQQGCTADSCSAEVLALGNIVVWWVGSLMIVALVMHGIARALQLRVGIRDLMWEPAVHSRVRWDVVGPLLVGIGAGWLPWIWWHERTTFTFYSIVFTPFMCMLAAYGITLFATRRVIVAAGPDEGAYIECEELDERRYLVAVLLVSFAVGFSIFFWPVWTGGVMPYAAWHSRMWLPTWV